MASLLPGGLRPALLWTIDLYATGEGIAVDVRRARVKSRAKLDYAGVQAGIDAGDADPMFAVLREIGELRIRREQRRGGISLPLPELEVRVADGRWALEFRARHRSEEHTSDLQSLMSISYAIF